MCHHNNVIRGIKEREPVSLFQAVSFCLEYVSFVIVCNTLQATCNYFLKTFNLLIKVSLWYIKSLLLGT